MTQDIEQRVEALEARLNIIELEATYARSFDEHDGERWSSLFTADGIYQSRPVGDEAPVTFVQGTTALNEYCSGVPFEGIHMLHLPQLAIDGDRATARIHLDFHGSWRNSADAPRLTMHGYYDVAYRRVDGHWRIAHRVTTAFSREFRTVLGYPTDSVLPSD
ncbi:nuclear transport factor 2 family protein [Rhodococcus sp. BP22]|uniref:nuclear transport factor 2 family protein n=1 Tax=Rhodococcus sp. BP22 TaxID=2758566 RepID=UPI0016475ED0|nr:nuclear transport factor 2 family protein [Rhodococcus sp. BP22]